DVAGTSLASLVKDLDKPGPRSGPGDFVNKVKGLFSGQLERLAQQGKAIAQQIAGEGPAGLLELGPALLQGLHDQMKDQKQDAVVPLDVVDRLRDLIGSDLGAALSVATLVQAMQRTRPQLKNIEKIPERIEQGLQNYFFRTTGYTTIDGVSVV